MAIVQQDRQAMEQVISQIDLRIDRYDCFSLAGHQIYLTGVKRGSDGTNIAIFSPFRPDSPFSALPLSCSGAVLRKNCTPMDIMDDKNFLFSEIPCLRVVEGLRLSTQKVGSIILFEYNGKKEIYVDII